MLFNSYHFLFAFLPIALCIYFICNHLLHPRLAKIWLLAASWFFYAWWNPVYLPLLLTSIGVNYLLSQQLIALPKGVPARKQLLLIGLFLNVGALGYFKYMDFFISNANWLGFDFPLLHLALPLAISFFTLQQVAYLVDVYRSGDGKRDLLSYCLFVSFFPQLIAGPIVHYKEIVPQLDQSENWRLSFANLSQGTFLFAIGLFKKVVLADTFAQWASNGFDGGAQLNLVEAWIVSYSYTLQLYFDFSGYSDMALGLALMFNIRLPQNFNSPYAATSIINLWQRWHMTLTRFINSYIYKPILRAFPTINFGYGMLASFISMVIAGVWHGAAWSFVVFGVLQGVAIVINHISRKLKIVVNPLLGWLITFHFFSFSLVIFRSLQWEDAARVYRGMLGLGGTDHWISVPTLFDSHPFWFFNYVQGALLKSQVATLSCLLLITYGIVHVALLPNSNQLAQRFSYSWRHLGAVICLLFAAIMLLSNPSEFIYFQF
jgi:alginate O-acetyltransferase complex protein AlgI